MSGFEGGTYTNGMIGERQSADGRVAALRTREPTLRAVGAPGAGNELAARHGP